MSNYNIHNSQIGAVGDNAVSYNNSFQQIATVKQELSKLLQEMQKRAETPEQKHAVNHIAFVETAISKGEETEVIEHLAKAGEYALEIAQDIGVNVVSSLISEAISKMSGA